LLGAASGACSLRGVRYANLPGGAKRLAKTPYLAPTAQGGLSRRRRDSPGVASAFGAPGKRAEPAPGKTRA